MKPSPAFQFYPSDFLVGAAEMSAEEAGAYIRLLCFQWTNNGVPDDSRKLAAMAGVSVDVIEKIRPKFAVFRNGRLFNARMESVRSQQEEYRSKQSENARKRWDAMAMPPHNNGTADGVPSVMPEGMPNACSSTSSTTLSSTTTTPSEKREALPWEEFMAQWNSLPKPFPRIQVMSTDRKKSLKARNADAFWLKNWREALSLLPSIPFMRGDGPQGWVADVEFFLRPDSVLKIMEGKYLEKKPATKAEQKAQLELDGYTMVDPLAP